jgi:hypothetical protein
MRTVALDRQRGVHVQVTTRGPQVLLHVVEKLRSALGDVTHLEADVVGKELRQLVEIAVVDRAAIP